MIPHRTSGGRFNMKMKRLATVLAAGAFALFAGSLVMVDTADAFRGGFGGGGGHFGGGGGMRSMSGGGGGMRSFSGGGGRSFSGAASRGMTSRSVSARHVNVSRRVSTGTTRTTRYVSSTRTTRVSKNGRYANAVTKSGRHVNVANNTNTSKLSNVRKPKIGTAVGAASLGVAHVNIGNTKSNTHVNVGNTGAGAAGLKPGPGNKPGGLAGLGNPGGLKPGPGGGGLKPGPAGGKPGPLGGLKAPPGGFKPAPGNITIINNRYVNVFRGPRQIWWAGAWVSLAALAVIPAVWVGGLEYDPWGYLALAEPSCSGVTPEGYRLRWQDVPTDTGAVVPQCVAYYPRGKAVPAVATGAVPGQAVSAAQPVAAAMAQGCLVEIYSQVAFTGMSSDVAADQPRLSEYGWDKQISSLDVKSGTWDFYSEADYGGQMVRLPPGKYENLEGWDKEISSLMCTQPK
jgi:hypothetical protein